MVTANRTFNVYDFPNVVSWFVYVVLYCLFYFGNKNDGRGGRGGGSSELR